MATSVVTKARSLPKGALILATGTGDRRAIVLSLGPGSSVNTTRALILFHSLPTYEKGSIHDYYIDPSDPTVKVVWQPEP